MSTMRFLLEHPIRARKVKEAAGSKCELCGKISNTDELEVHTFIDPGEEQEMPAEELECFLLVLCPQCHEDLHELPAGCEVQQMLVGQREDSIKRRIRAILGYIPSPYTPPDSDVEAAYKDACASKFGNLI
ncbi:MAG: hypothetical protein A4E37_00621 [Methanoregulaceae archaeon PtaB.Bin056]|jgi:hypothetical protein|nr:MAG: hypothetical protein A4E37_00621 [Methanoregulaceae archaeon PtaB.Bin056]